VHIAILQEPHPVESRVAASPESVGKLTKAGHRVTVVAGAGAGASMPDAVMREAGAEIAPDNVAAVGQADLVFAVRMPDANVRSAIKSGTGLVGLLNPFDQGAEIAELAQKGVIALAMEFTPRITRAQTMDALSSQANLAGYRAVIEAAAAFGRAFPMMMTAAGTVPPARVFVMGAGVAGLQAIATARRLGAQVSATDVRPAAKEQVESLAAKFIAVENEEFAEAQTAGGYAKEMSDDYKRQQAELTASHIAKQNIVITTALIPGRPAPRLVSAEMVASMPEGAVIVDLATERGGNVEGAVPDEVVVKDGRTIIGWTNMPGRLAADASALYAKNLLNLLPLLSAEEGGFSPAYDDEIISGMLLTRDGAVVHPRLQPEPA